MQLYSSLLYCRHSLLWGICRLFFFVENKCFQYSVTGNYCHIFDCYGVKHTGSKPFTFLLLSWARNCSIFVILQCKRWQNRDVLRTHLCGCTVKGLAEWCWVGTTVFRRMQNFELSRGICPFLWNFYVFTEFCGIWYWAVIRRQIRHILVESRLPCCMYTWFHNEIHDCHSGFDLRNTENIKLSLSEVLPVNLVDRLYLSVAVSGDKYCIFGWVQRR